MIKILNLHSGTKLSDWLCHCLVFVLSGIDAANEWADDQQGKAMEIIARLEIRYS
jgi:hypothetical protein